MTGKWSSVILLGLLGWAGCTRERRPTLVVMIAVDGLGAGLLERYDPMLTGGFRRLRDQGFRFTNATVDHALTISHPGHVTLSTGMTPAHHGIVDAAFYQPGSGHWRLVDAVQDSAERINGIEGRPGASPRKILVGGLADWLTDADSGSRVVAIGTGQYSSLLHAGHVRGDVYWFLVAAGRYVTSSYYREGYPEWLARFNRERLPGFIDSSITWNNTASPEAQRLARPDEASYEAYGGQTTFPHVFKDETPPTAQANLEARRFWFGTTPMPDAATLALAAEAVRARKLGQRQGMATDYLAIVVSQVDDIGHSFGWRSQEELDNLFRLDRELGEFFGLLDASVGRDRYIVALSADHGMMDLPEYQRESGEPGRRLSEGEIGRVLERVRLLVAHSRGTRDSVAADVARLLERSDFVADAMTPAELTGSAPAADSFVALYRNSYRADRVPRFPLFAFSDGTSPIGEAGVAVRLTRGTIIDLDRAVHGSPYDYDRRVPLMFMGVGVPAGSSAAPARTVDVAPTLARLAGIPLPSGLDGRPLLALK